MLLGSFLMISGLLIMLGTMVIAILFTATEKSSAAFALTLATLVSALIAIYNLATMTYSSTSDKALAIAMGVVAVLMAIFFRQKPGWMAKIVISSTILIGLTQLIFVH